MLFFGSHFGLSFSQSLLLVRTCLHLIAQLPDPIHNCIILWLWDLFYGNWQSYNCPPREEVIFCCRPIRYTHDMSIKSEAEWRRHWKPDLCSCPWKSITVNSNTYLIKMKIDSSDYEIILTDFSNFWFESLGGDPLKARIKVYNFVGIECEYSCYIYLNNS